MSEKEFKPLDLEWLGKVLRTNNDGEFKSWCEKFNRDLKKAVKQQIQEACEFYLRYKDHPKLLVKEHPEYKKEFDKFFTSYYKIFYEYNKWLFKLTFKPVFEKVKRR